MSTQMTSKVKGMYAVAFAGWIALAGCSQKQEAAAPPPKAAEEEPLRSTVWTNNGELFLEHPALIANKKVRFAIHRSEEHHV